MPPPRINILERLPHYLVVNKPPQCYSQPPDTSPANRKLALEGINPDDTVLSHLRHSYADLFDSAKNPALLNPPFCAPKVVHRLDYPVSGAMVLATSTQAAAHFSKNLKLGGDKGWLLQKYYAALVLGAPKRNTFLQKAVTWTPDIVVPQDTAPQNQQQPLTIATGIISKPIDGKPAFTRFWIPPQPPVALPYTLVLFSPLTGKKHQIRRHAAQVLRTPILGDSLYTAELDDALARAQAKKVQQLTHRRRLKLPADPARPFADAAAPYPVNGIALHSYMVHLQMGLRKSSVKAPFFGNTEAWEPFLEHDGSRLLPEYIYKYCEAEKMSHAP